MNKLELLKQQSTAAQMGEFIAEGSGKDVLVIDVIETTDYYLGKDDDHGFPISGDHLTRTKAHK